MGEELPVDEKVDGEILPVVELQKLFEQRQVEYRKKVLGPDAVLDTSGSVETTNGCVMTAANVINVIRKKKEQDFAKFLLDEKIESRKKRRKNADVYLLFVLLKRYWSIVYVVRPPGK